MSLKRIPVTVVSGFLGAGKTTLVNHLLSQCSDQYIGVIVNEFGEVGIDGELIVADETPVIEITNGCICCTVRKDLTSAVTSMLERAERPIDRLIVETSGLADPAPVLQSFLADPQLLVRVELESVITVIDGCHLLQHLDDPLVREQIAFADVLVLNKMDAASLRTLDRLGHELRRLNPAAHLIGTRHSQVSAPEVLGTKRFSLPHVLALEPDLLEGDEHDHSHDTSITSCCVDIERALDPQCFNRWINQLLRQDGARLLRSKGILNFAGEARQFHVHSVHMLVDSRPGRRWRADEVRRSRMVFIGRALVPASLRRGLEECAAVPARSVTLPPMRP